MTKTDKKKKLLKQILKFGVVGGIAFLIDFIIYSIVLNLVEWEYDYLLAGIAGFMVSLIFNYLASMAFVFERKDNADKKKEFLIFMVLSLIGLGVNTIVLWLCMDVTYSNWAWLQSVLSRLTEFLHENGINVIENAKELASYLAKIIATGIVMIYNFISRKMTLEKKDDENETKGQDMQEAETV